MAPLRLWVSKLDISYRSNSYIVSYRFIYRIIPICLYHTDMFHIVLICILLMVLLLWKWTSNWEIWGNWPMLLTFLVVQINSNLLIGQASVHSVQLSMNWAKCLPPLSSLLYSLIPIFCQDRPVYTVYSGQWFEPSAYHLSVAHPLRWWQHPKNSS